jgi:hypothetical protein
VNLNSPYLLLRNWARVITRESRHDNSRGLWSNTDSKRARAPQKFTSPRFESQSGWSEKAGSPTAAAPAGFFERVVQLDAAKGPRDSGCSESKFGAGRLRRAVVGVIIFFTLS